jgi:hypothetical protein
MLQIEQQGVSSKSNPVMGHDGCDDSVFVFYMLHAPSDGVES